MGLGRKIGTSMPAQGGKCPRSSFQRQAVTRSQVSSQPTASAPSRLNTVFSWRLVWMGCSRGWLHMAGEPNTGHLSQAVLALRCFRDLARTFWELPSGSPPRFLPHSEISDLYYGADPVPTRPCFFLLLLAFSANKFTCTENPTLLSAS